MPVPPSVTRCSEPAKKIGKVIGKKSGENWGETMSQTPEIFKIREKNRGKYVTFQLLHQEWLSYIKEMCSADDDIQPGAIKCNQESMILDDAE